ncbi:hypothetical protein AMATHDRAFT_49466 [Amanita thiersii Skay4041]|uniref:Uncharacterized protein n=1 Tax=Amanita thiersii Skay4041 TaxID=703135 RepID=A0A2A9NGV4_9AGAR|nr:hypothetical protein AMATHDRAFT_49466 [Amanita thiersii Skay4041]
MRLNITIPNTSPLLRFAPLQAWSEEEQVMDIPLLDDGYYRPKTYRVTNATVGGVLSFRWNGTGIWLYGGYRKRLGPYNVTLDGRVTSLDGFRAGDEEAGDGLLFGQGDLSTGTEHHLEVRPVWGTFDVDYVRVFRSQSLFAFLRGEQVGFETEIMAVDVSSSVLDAASDNFAYASADADGDDGDDVHVDYHVLTSKYGSATPSGTVTSDSHIRLNYYGIASTFYALSLF